MRLAKPTLLVIGSQDSGKSTYRAQVYQRAEHCEGALRLAKSVSNTGHLDADVARLIQGLQPLHTRSDVYQYAALDLKDSEGRIFSLEFADYGGEQVKNIGNSNSISASWFTRAQESNAWLFFLRIDHLRPRKDFMTSPVPTISEAAGEDVSPFEVGNSLEVGAIETLQRLLFAKGASLRHRLEVPHLGVLLSCWDELSEGERAQSVDQILMQRAPLFYQFVRSNWAADSVNIWALSSTEKKLPEIEPDIDFVIKGAEKIGFVIDEGGQRSSDLTLPIHWLLQRHLT